jgi:hypothetical protein
MRARKEVVRWTHDGWTYFVNRRTGVVCRTRVSYVTGLPVTQYPVDGPDASLGCARAWVRIAQADARREAERQPSKCPTCQAQARCDCQTWDDVDAEEIPDAPANVIPRA